MRAPDPVRRQKVRFLETIRAVAWSFFGVRGNRARERDFARLNPVHVIVAGLLMAVLFILTLIAIARAAAG
ncbi:MAG: DUF2970 domain-containing protein [Burkholderiaceae bacterium]|nr:DUF2970 domain-containing protein [Burkholderiaceae bacterium]